MTDTGAGKVVFNSTSADKKSGELPTGAGAHAIAFRPDGARAYVANQLAGSVTIVDPTTRMSTGTLTVGSKPNGIVFRSTR